jgi:hypothetical protein
MKNLIVATMFLLTSLITFSQFKYPLSKYGLKSNIWEAEPYDYDKNLTSFGPKGGGVFSYDESYLKEIDIKKIQANLEKSFNEFRKSYNYKPAKIDQKLITECIEDAKNMDQKKGVFKNNNKNAKQFWDKIPVFMFGSVDTKKIDINKAISDSFFDYFVGDDEAMGVVLDDQNKKYGFGIYYNQKDYGFYLVVKNK